MKKIQCPVCGKTLFYADAGIIEIKCTREKCGAVTKFEIKDGESVKHTVIHRE